MKKIIISEEEKNSIIEKYYSKIILFEQPMGSYFRKLFSKTNPQQVWKNIVGRFTGEAAENLEVLFAKALSNKLNLTTINAERALLGARGTKISFSTIEDLLDLASQKPPKINIDDVRDLLPEYLADGTKFREIFVQSLENNAMKKAAQGILTKGLDPFQKRFLLPNCVTYNNCADGSKIISDFYSKLSPTAKWEKFYPTDAKLLSKTVLFQDTKYPREVILVRLKDQLDVLFYQSAGANTATTGKLQGEWITLPGFGSDGWLFKTPETVELTKGGNKYLTQMAEFLELNGAHKLGK